MDITVLHTATLVLLIYLELLLWEMVLLEEDSKLKLRGERDVFSDLRFRRP